MVLLIVFFVVSILFSFLCSIWEAVLLSITPSFINRSIQEESDIAGTLMVYKDDIDRPLSAILTMNTIAHTVGAIGVGAQAGKLFGGAGWHLAGINLNPESIIAALMTLAILIFSEIIPKTIGANYWPRLVPFTIRSLRVLRVVLWPERSGNGAGPIGGRAAREHEVDLSVLEQGARSVLEAIQHFMPVRLER